MCNACAPSVGQASLLDNLRFDTTEILADRGLNSRFLTRREAAVRNDSVEGGRSSVKDQTKERVLGAMMMGTMKIRTKRIGAVLAIAIVIALTAGGLA